MNSGVSQWKALGLTLLVLIAFGMINDKTERVAIGIAVILATLLFLKKFGEVTNK